MSQKTLSELTGIRLPTLSEYENSTAKTVRIEYLEKLCEVFNCELSDIDVVKQHFTLSGDIKYQYMHIKEDKALSIFHS